MHARKVVNYDFNMSVINATSAVKCDGFDLQLTSSCRFNYLNGRYNSHDKIVLNFVHLS